MKTFIVACLLMAPNAFAEFKNPKCQTHTQKFWTTRYEVCLEAFEKTGVFSNPKALCECVTDKFINDLTCEEFRQIAEGALESHILPTCERQTGAR